MKTHRITLDVTYDPTEHDAPHLWRWDDLTGSEARVVQWQEQKTAAPSLCPECGGSLALDEIGDAACGACGLTWEAADD